MLIEIAAYVSLLIILSFLLVQSADLIEDAFVLVAKKLGVSPFVIGFVILGVASSLPEMSLMFSSTANNAQSISLGNLLGATIILMTVVVAINVFKHKQIKFSGRFSISQVVVSLGVLSLQVVLIADGRLDRVEGLIAFACYLAFVLYIFREGNKRKHLHEHAKVEVGRLSTLLLRAGGGVLGLVFVSSFLVEAAIVTADLLHIPQSTVGLIVLAVGTNLPELVIAIRGNSKESEQLAIGNFIGSATVNTALVALLGVFNYGEITNFTAILPSVVVLATTIILFAILAWSDRKINREEGIILLGVYVMLLLSQAAILYLSSPAAPAAAAAVSVIVGG